MLLEGRAMWLCAFITLCIFIRNNAHGRAGRGVMLGRISLLPLLGAACFYTTFECFCVHRLFSKW